jgi:hypothetical protein
MVFMCQSNLNYAQKEDNDVKDAEQNATNSFIGFCN